MSKHSATDTDPRAALAALGLTLPKVKSDPNYANVRTTANGQIYVSGQLPYSQGVLAAKGVVGEDGAMGTEVSITVAREMMVQATLNGLAVAADAAGGIEKLRIVQIQVFVASAHGFGRQSDVADAGSDLLVEVFGKPGRHARTAVGVVGLPKNSPVEMQMICETRI